MWFFWHALFETLLVLVCFGMPLVCLNIYMIVWELLSHATYV